jgi:hypothetical protein
MPWKECSAMEERLRFVARVSPAEQVRFSRARAVKMACTGSPMSSLLYVVGGRLAIRAQERQWCATCGGPQELLPQPAWSGMGAD